MTDESKSSAHIAMKKVCELAIQAKVENVSCVVPTLPYIPILLTSDQIVERRAERQKDGDWSKEMRRIYIPK